MRSVTGARSGGTATSASAPEPNSSSSESAGEASQRASILWRGQPGDSGLGSAGGGGGVPKSTAGGLEIVASSWTVKFCFGFCPNIFAVRFVGNERTVTLYARTASM